MAAIVLFACLVIGALAADEEAELAKLPHVDEAVNAVQPEMSEDLIEKMIAFRFLFKISQIRSFDDLYELSSTWNPYRPPKIGATTRDPDIPEPPKKSASFAHVHTMIEKMDKIPRLKELKHKNGPHNHAHVLHSNHTLTPSCKKFLEFYANVTHTKHKEVVMCLLSVLRPRPPASPSSDLASAAPPLQLV